VWNRDQIEEGTSYVDRAFRSGQVGPYAIQGAIAALHSAAGTVADTDWAQIVGLYGLLARLAPSPVVELNRAVAVAMRDGPAAGLALIDEIVARGELPRYHLVHAARADLLRRLGETNAAVAEYQRAIALTSQEPERRFLERRLAETAGRS
jgi:RNA polymerase sigma-70 factor, ECF subfamily